MTLDRSSFGSVLRNSMSASEEAPPCRALGAMTHYPRVYLLALIDAECQWTRPTLSSHHSRRPPRKEYLHKRSEIGRSGVIRLSSTECEWTVDVAARGCSGLSLKGLWAVDTRLGRLSSILSSRLVINESVNFWEVESADDDMDPCDRLRPWPRDEAWWKSPSRRGRGGQYIGNYYSSVRTREL